MEPLVYKRRPFRLAPNSEELRAQQRSRPESWRELWPDDPPLLEVRDRLSRLLRLYYHWPSAAFIPEDSMKALVRTGGPEEFFFHEPDFDLWELCPDYDDDWFMSAHNGQTFMDLVRAVADKVRERPGRFAYFDAKAFEPLIHGSETWSSAGVCYYGHYCGQRLRHALRTPAWRERWPDDPDLIKLRDRAGPVLARYFLWIDDAFIPEDLMAAIIYGPPTFGGHYSAAAEALRRALEPEADPGPLMKTNGLTYLDFLRAMM